MYSYGIIGIEHQSELILCVCDSVVGLKFHIAKYDLIILKGIDASVTYKKCFVSLLYLIRHPVADHLI